MLSLKAWSVVAALVGIIASFLIGMRVGGNLADASHARDETLAQMVSLAAQEGAAIAIAKNKPTNQYRTQVLEREIVRVPDYTNCKHSADGLRVLNDALEGRPAAAGDLSVPPVDSNDR